MSNSNKIIITIFPTKSMFHHFPFVNVKYALLSNFPILIYFFNIFPVTLSKRGFLHNHARRPDPRKNCKLFNKAI